MTIHTNGTNGSSPDDGGWAYNEVPRDEFYDELGGLLTQMAELVDDDPQGAPEASEELQNDWFYAGYGGAEDNYYVGLWPAYRPFVAGHEMGEVSDAEYAQMCWPKSNGHSVLIYLGGADAVTELAEDETSTQELAHSFAELAGITLVDDWDAGEDEDDTDEGAA